MKRTIFTIALTVLIGLGIQNIITKEEPVYTGEYRTHIVRQGDTLWSIANDLDLNEPIDKTVYTIKKDNNIENAGNLQIGQEIKIRVYGKEVK